MFSHCRQVFTNFLCGKPHPGLHWRSLPACHFAMKKLLIWRNGKNVINIGGIAVLHGCVFFGELLMPSLGYNWMWLSMLSWKALIDWQNIFVCVFSVVHVQCVLVYSTMTSYLTHQYVFSHKRTKELCSGSLSLAGKKSRYLWPMCVCPPTWRTIVSTEMEMSWWEKGLPHYVASLGEHSIIVWSPFINLSEVLYSLSLYAAHFAGMDYKKMLAVL